MKKICLLLSVLTTSFSFAATLNCSVKSENEDGKQVVLIKESRTINSSMNASIKKTFIVGEETLEFSATTRTSNVINDAATISSMQIVTPGWERLKFPLKGTYIAPNRYTSHIQSQELFLVNISEITGEKTFISAECEIISKT